MRLVIPILAAAALSCPGQVRVPIWLERTGAADTAPEFQAALGGRPARVVAVKGPADDLLLLVVLDLTQDLIQATAAKEALASAIAGLPDRTTVSVLRAQDSLRVLCRPTADRRQAILAIESLPVSGKAGLLETIEPLGKAGDSVLKKTPVRAAILYVTDSDIQNYRENFTNPAVNSSDTRDLSRKFPEFLIQERINSLAARLSRQQTPAFIVHLVYRADRLNEAYQSGLQQLAEVTGGTALFCRSAAEAAATVGKTIRTIQDHYSLTLAVPAGVPRTPLEVELTASGGNRSLTHRTRVSLGK